jgi:hypothetical protein
LIARRISYGIHFKYAKIIENGIELIKTTQMDLVEYNRPLMLPSDQSYLNWNISLNQTLIMKLDYVQLFDIFDLGINSNQFLIAVKNKLITMTAKIKRYKINFK